MKAKVLIIGRRLNNRREYVCVYGLPSLHVECVRDSESGALLAAKERWRWLLGEMSKDPFWQTTPP